MELKTNLHFHTKEDSKHSVIKYSLKEGVDKASDLNFDVLALTLHGSFIWNNKWKEYAKQKGILLIPGIEAKIKGKEVLVLNCDKNIEKVKTFKELRRYKAKNPNIFIIAPHPYFYGFSPLKKKFEENIDIFDAIEHSWFYTKLFNRNKRGARIAKKYNLPLIATSDTHFFNFLNTDYAVIDAEEKSIESIFRAIRKNEFKNKTRPKKIFSEFFWPQARFMIKNFLNKFK